MAHWLSSTIRLRSSMTPARRISMMLLKNFISRTKWGMRRRSGSTKRRTDVDHYRMLSETRMNSFIREHRKSKNSIEEWVKLREQTRTLKLRKQAERDNLKSPKSNWLKRSVILMKSCRVKKRLERCGLRDMRKSRRNTLRPMLIFFMPRANLKIKYLRLRISK